MRHLSIPWHAAPAGRLTVLLNLRDISFTCRALTSGFKGRLAALTICFSSLMLVSISHSKSSRQALPARSPGRICTSICTCSQKGQHSILCFRLKIKSPALCLQQQEKGGSAIRRYMPHPLPSERRGTASCLTSHGREELVSKVRKGDVSRAHGPLIAPSLLWAVRALQGTFGPKDAQLNLLRRLLLPSHAKLCNQGS